MACPYNSGLKECMWVEKKCNKCGWNPDVAKARIELVEIPHPEEMIFRGPNGKMFNVCKAESNEWHFEYYVRTHLSACCAYPANSIAEAISKYKN